MGRFKLFAGVAALALVALACGEEGSSDDGAAGGGGGGGPTVEITAPEDGAEVGATFTLEFSSSEDLGPIDTGANHVHVWFDGDESKYEVVETSSFDVSGLSPGEHEITASLRNADHTPAGAEDTITVTLAAGAGTGEGKKENDTGYDY
ncbi:MAG: Ig-like domain-containing protein [Actinomycetota bacterium]